MTEAILTDDEIAALTPEQRRELISRLEAPLSALEDPVALNRMRRIRLGLIVSGLIVMIPWIAYLALVLPQKYVANNWPATWIGFDILLVVFMAATAVLGYLRRQLLILAAFTTGVLLICDAWFDLMTAGPEDAAVSVVTAVLIQAPMAYLLISGALRVMRLTWMRLWFDPEMRLWQVPLMP
jgi:hypothetical protein